MGKKEKETTFPGGIKELLKRLGMKQEQIKSKSQQPDTPSIAETVETNQGKREQPEGILDEEGLVKPGKHILTRETARQFLSSPDYHKISRAEQAAVRRLADIKVANPHFYQPEEENPPFLVLSDFQDIYEKRKKKLKREQTIKYRIENPGEKDASKRKWVVDFRREKLTDPNDLIAAVYDVLINALYRREIAIGTNNFLEYALSRLEENREIYSALNTWSEAVTGLIKLWERGVKGDKNSNKTIEGLIDEGSELPNALLHYLLCDPKIEKAYHEASAREASRLRFAEELTIKKEKGKKPRVISGYKKENGKYKERKREEAAFDNAGEILHVVTLKIRFDPSQASKHAYIVYKTDQPGLQLSEGKYDHTEVARLLRLNYKRTHKPRVELIWNNGMPTYWTNAVRDRLVNKWIELITSGKYPDARTIAWLISYAGDNIDRRIPDFEGLDFEEWLAIKDPEEKKRRLQVYLDKFKQDLSAGGVRAERATHALRSNLSRMRTVWHPEITSVRTGLQIDFSSKIPGAPRGVPVNEQGYDLDAIWFNPETRQWEYCLNYRWFFQSEDTESPDMTGEDLSGLAVYEGYKISHWERGVYPTTKASSFEDFSKRPEVIDVLLARDLGKQLYSVPEYRELIIDHLINEIARQEMTAQLYTWRYRGRALNFLEGVKEKTFYLEWLLNKNLHFEDCGIKGNWAEAQTEEVQSTTPGKRIRQVMQENSHVAIWTYFAEKAGIDLETLLIFAGVKRLSAEEISQLQTKGEIRPDLSPELFNNYLLLDYLNLRIVKNPSNPDQTISTKDVLHDNIDEGEWLNQLVRLLRHDYRNKKEGKESLTEKLVRLGKLVAPYEDGQWALKVAEKLLENAQRIRQSKKTTEKAIEQAEVDEAIAEELRRFAKDIPPSDSTDWRFLNVWDVMALARRLNWEYEADTEFFPDYNIAKKKGKANNWYDMGAGVMAVDFLKARKRVNKRTYQHVIPLGKYRGHHLFRQWHDDEQSSDYGTPSSRRTEQGISLIRNLWGGWWTFRPETGLAERPPFYVEMDMVGFMASLLNSPYRMETAQRLADEAYRDLKNKDSSYPLTPQDRRSKEWFGLYEARLKQQMMIAPGPDWWEAELALLSYLGLVNVEGKAVLDERPKDQFSRWLGVETLEDPNGSGADKYRSYLLHRLNIRRVVPRVTNPEQVEQVLRIMKEHRQKEFDPKKYAFIAPEQLEMLAFLGLDIIDIGREYSETTADDACQRLYKWSGTLTPLAAYWSIYTFFGVPFDSLFLHVAFNSIIPLTLRRWGTIFGTDLGNESALQKVSIFKIPFLFDFKVNAKTIVDYQKTLWPLASIFTLGIGFVNGWGKPLVVRREEELLRGAAHQTLLKSGHAATWIDMWKEKFGR